MSESQKKVKNVFLYVPLGGTRTSDPSVYEQEVEAWLRAGLYEEGDEGASFNIFSHVFFQRGVERSGGVHPAGVKDLLKGWVDMVVVHPWNFHDPRYAAHVVHSCWVMQKPLWVPELYDFKMMKNGHLQEVIRLALLGPYWRSQKVPQW